MGLDLFDILAVILGILFTIRKLDAQKRTQKEFPHVPLREFSIWQARETATYSVGMLACFSKVFAKLFVVYVASSRVDYETLRSMGMVIDLGWLAITIVTLYRAYGLTKERERLGIVLGGMVVRSNSSELDAELKHAIARFRQGAVDESAARFHELSLDSDETQKALALYFLGECFVQQGKPAEARDAFIEALEIDPSLVEPRDALGRLDEVQDEA